MDLRAYLSKTIHKHEFVIPQSSSTSTDNRYPDKAKLLETILTLRAGGMSYREIAWAIGVHFTRVQQILKTAQNDRA
jgi:hypothetical protein